MTINSSNAHVINSKNVNLHDSILHQLHFVFENGNLCVSISKPQCKPAIITFVNVIGFNMTACDFWGSSSHILDFEYVDPSSQTLLPTLTDKAISAHFPARSKLFLKKNYIETRFILASGDELTIACEYIII